MPKDRAIYPPLTSAQQLGVDDGCVVQDRRPWGKSTASATAFWSEGGRVELVRSKLHEGAYVLQSPDVIHQGLPVLQTNVGRVHTRTMAERLEAAAQRGRRARIRRANHASLSVGAPHCPEGVPRGIHPKVASAVDDRRYGISARGRKTLLSAESTIINGESRSLVFPDRYPYTAVCKLNSSFQPSPGAAFQRTGQATGFLIGRSTMMTSGHVGPPTDRPWQIQVIPACWGGRSIFGPGMVTFVKSTWSWNSDAGSDIKICQLFDPIGDQLGFFGYRGYDSDWEDGAYWTMAGFPFDISLTAMSRETDIAVRDDDDGDDIDVDGDTYDTTQVESDADEADGVSGAPLWGWWEAGPYAIGVHHGVERDGTITGSGIETRSCASGGDGFVAAAHWGRSMWG
jgi:hypothetical protein